MNTIFSVILVFVVIVILSSSKKKSSVSNQKNLAEEPKLHTIDLSFEDSETTDGCYLILDVETDGLPRSKYAYPEEVNNWPRVLQISWMLFDESGRIIDFDNSYLKPVRPIPATATEKNGITDKLLREKGKDPDMVWPHFIEAVNNSKVIVAHNIEFDLPIIEAELIRNKLGKHLSDKKTICTMKEGTNYCLIPSQYGSGCKYPRLDELYKELFFPDVTQFRLNGMHNAQVDAAVTAKCFFKMVEIDWIILDFLKEKESSTKTV